MSDHSFEDKIDISNGIADTRQNGHQEIQSNGVRTPTSKHSSSSSSSSRADEIQSLLLSVLAQLVPFIQRADTERESHVNQQEEPQPNTSLVDPHAPSELLSILTSSGTLSLPSQGTGPSGLAKLLSTILKYSVNPSAPGFLDKLYSAPLPPGIAAELILAVLNTNVHVYQVSPVLSLIETHVTRTLANMFGFDGPRAGGINVQGGSASNTTAIVIARNTLFPETKRLGNQAGEGRELVIFTSEHGHYSIEKAAQQCGLGSAAVISVPVDPVTGEMEPSALESLIETTKQQGKTPFFVNATAGTTVLGSFDPFVAISQIARRHGLWMHIDGAWGGSFVFSEPLRRRALEGCELADSIAINPHKMMGVPVTCSFLLLRDLRHAHVANTLRAGYLFHDKTEEGEYGDAENAIFNGERTQSSNGTYPYASADEDWSPPTDLADLTLQCGRRGDSLKLFLSWQYYGTQGYARKIETAYHGVACHLADLVDRHPDMLLVSTNPPPCLQVCFYYAPRKKLVHSTSTSSTASSEPASTADEAAQEKEREREKERIQVGKRNSAFTARITQSLIPRGFMVDYAPALEHQVERGAFFRVVVNISTARETVQRLVDEIARVGREVV